MDDGELSKIDLSIIDAPIRKFGGATKFPVWINKIFGRKEHRSHTASLFSSCQYIASHAVLCISLCQYIVPLFIFLLCLC